MQLNYSIIVEQERTKQEDCIILQGLIPSSKDLHVVDCKYYGYLEILSVVKNSARAAATAVTTISFDDAVRKAYCLNGNLKRYLDSFSRANHTPLFDNKSLTKNCCTILF
jgi:hypothetical protein